MTYPFSEPSSSVTELMTELSRVKAAIRRIRKPPGADQVSQQELLRLYARERAVLRRLRRRRRQWRAQTGLSDEALAEGDTLAEPS